MKFLTSWRRAVNGLLTLIIIIVILFLTWSNGYYNSQIQANNKIENANTLNVWENFVKLRLEKLWEHVFELLLTVYNNTELAYGTSDMEYMTQKKCIELMTDKFVINTDADCFYLMDMQNGMALFAANPSLSYARITALKNGYKGVGPDSATKLSDRLWEIEFIDGEAYFAKSVALGKFVAGTMSRIDRYDIDKNFNIQGDRTSCLLVSGNDVCFTGGGEDLSAMLRVNENGAISFDCAVTMVLAPLSFTGGASVVLAARQSGLTDLGGGRATSVILLCVSMLCAALLLILMFVLNRKVVKPTNELLRANNEIISGNIDYRITANAGSDEFTRLFDSFNEMSMQIANLRIDSYEGLLREQESQLLLLRAQLKPHFFLNAITTVSNMTYQNRLEDIREYLQSLAKFIRYMFNPKRKFITVSEEIQHIKNYLRMQALRFPGSIDAAVDCADDVGKTNIPILMLFTLVENSFKHAMSLYETLWLSIRCERIETENFTGCRLTVEDNGGGFTEEQLTDIGTDGVVTPKDHIGLSNVRYTLRLVYRRPDLLRISNNENGGAHTEIWIPDGV
jgi:HAMP domain-containing protein